jgi:Uma2 family endonuclease
MHGPKHRACIRKLTAFVSKVDTPERHAQVQLPIVCATDQMPEPDFAVIRGTDADYANSLPTAADTFMVLEASDSSLERDRDEKLPIYAAAGIEQYIIFDLRSDTAINYSEPDRSTATYAKAEPVKKGGVIVLRVGVGQFVSMPLADLLP